ADLLEQLRAASVVEELGREVLGRSGEARQSFVAQGAIPGWQDVVVQLYSQCHSELPGQAQPGELPAHGRLEKVAISGADMALRGGTTAAAQDHLPGHELAVVLAQAAFERAEAGVGAVGAGCPFPNITEQLRRPFSRFGGDRLQMIAFKEVA